MLAQAVWYGLVVMVVAAVLAVAQWLQLRLRLKARGIGGPWGLPIVHNLFELQRADANHALYEWIRHQAEATDGAWAW